MQWAYRAASKHFNFLSINILVYKVVLMPTRCGESQGISEILRQSCIVHEVYAARLAVCVVSRRRNATIRVVRVAPEYNLMFLEVTVHPFSLW